MKYTKKQIEGARQLLRQGLTYRQIADKLGFATPLSAAYHANPRRRKRIIENAKRWQKNNPEKVKANFKRYLARHK